MDVLSWAKNDNAALEIRKQGRRHPGKDAEGKTAGKKQDEIGWISKNRLDRQRTMPILPVRPVRINCSQAQAEYQYEIIDKQEKKVK